ncbi:hypothetical protein [Flavobacterium subsaxonicum]|uniref:Uncharacterized protein n=1 Tax=Flavobacterium subsaxonicum WB 4.1-42 = DSM 21790 TaxID=1121898 RepID=A0A0A2MY62_9FLAO|nr:hypothetical protein [Flavobacterium subsaxonicum]KGO93140.1 hypothetical protein Q766_09320 [Flavobacterium subsaxonicum WB 4.1-42 = DSM 21790]
MDKYLSLIENGSDAYINSLEKIGWFTVPQNDKQIVAKCLADTDNNKYLVFGLAHLSFDAESFDKANDYRRLLDKIAALAGFTVVSSQFEYNYGEESETLRGTINTAGNTYNFELEELFGEWYHPDFTKFLNQELLPGERVDSCFFDLPGIDQGINFVFVPQAIYNKAIEEEIIPNMDYFIENFE